jgi:hypothetical protein
LHAAFRFPWGHDTSLPFGAGLSDNSMVNSSSLESFVPFDSSFSIDSCLDFFDTEFFVTFPGWLLPNIANASSLSVFDKIISMESKSCSISGITLPRPRALDAARPSGCSKLLCPIFMSNW